MNIRFQIEPAIAELATEYFAPHYWFESSKAITNLGAKLLENLIDSDLNESELKRQLAIILSGTLVSALAWNQSKFKDVFKEPATFSEGSYNGQLYYPLVWSDLVAECGLQGEPVDPKDITEERFFHSLIEKVGAKVLSRQLPFEVGKFMELFPQIKNNLGLINFYMMDPLQGIQYPAEQKEIELEVSLPQAAKPDFVRMRNAMKLETETLAREARLKKHKEEAFKKIHDQYLKPYTFQFFKWGPQHTERSQQVYYALLRTQDPDVMRKIVNGQLDLLKLRSNAIDDNLLVAELKAEVGLSERWTRAGKLVNRTSSTKTKAFVFALTQYQKAIDELYPERNYRLVV